MLKYIAQDSLSLFSNQASELWGHLSEAATPEEEEVILQALWETQGEQEKAIDTQAELADQLDAEIAAIKARRQHLLDIHNTALERLERWRNSLDATVLRLNSFGTIPNIAIGRSRQIVVKENPPSCEVQINPQDLPEEYRTEKTTYTPNRRKIVAAWSRGVPVEGTHVFKKRKVEYQLVASNSGNQAVAFAERAEIGEEKPKKTRKSKSQ